MSKYFKLYFQMIFLLNKWFQDFLGAYFLEMFVNFTSKNLYCGRRPMCSQENFHIF
jgi:hypothetical protein